MRQKWHRQLHERAAAGGAERGSPGTGACPSSSGRGNAWLQPAFGDRQLLLVPRTSLSPGLMRDAYGGMLPWPQRPYKLTGDVTPPPPPPPPKARGPGLQGLETPGLLPALLPAVSVLTRAQLC